MDYNWVYYKVYLNEPNEKIFLFSEVIKRLPQIPEYHRMIDPNKINSFLTTAYHNYVDILNEKYNFSLALRWYLDSISTRIDVMRFISAAISFECILTKYAQNNDNE